MRDLDAPPPRQVAVVVKLLLQLQGLITGVGLAASLPVSPCAQYVKENNQCGWEKPGERLPLRPLGLGSVGGRAHFPTKPHSYFPFPNVCLPSSLNVQAFLEAS